MVPSSDSNLLKLNNLAKFVLQFPFLHVRSISAIHAETFTLRVGGMGCPLRIRWIRSSRFNVRSMSR